MRKDFILKNRLIEKDRIGIVFNYRVHQESFERLEKI